MAASLCKLSLRRAVRLAFIREKSLKLNRSFSRSRCFAQYSENNGPSSANESSPKASSAPIAQVSATASPTEGALDKFAKVVDKVKKASAESDTIKSRSNMVAPDDPNESFASMFRKSKFVSLGEHKGRLVQGEIIEVMEDDLYIDFGGKFHCVCPRPKRNGNRYHRGTKVLLNLQCMEMSSAFLGSDIHVTLLEADATLLGLTAAQSRKAQT
ncbi:28S ribosomal protein S28, mitochondrial [Elysia marginata]|uniref:28S ribosomal protein S28, mitochondrial n=1 Tax=Elysia marginata TaxID=1093978 RepID=A0AAV4JEG5_9GAST|nr:28S ribosomal protein S28, mitochondrial [Elysia marginata]